MSNSRRAGEFDERIRELCARVVRTEGPEFQFAIMELANAITLWQSVNDGEDNERAAKAG
jgi:hypothetical protein